ncbi:MAG: hypothetical protein KC493_16980 [Bacteriovoracaceae bacterium]|nr:hypothetical protein [Bacteriovoracaceae bacterium]
MISKKREELFTSQPLLASLNAITEIDDYQTSLIYLIRRRWYNSLDLLCFQAPIKNFELEDWVVFPNFPGYNVEFRGVRTQENIKKLFRKVCGFGVKGVKYNDHDTYLRFEKLLMESNGYDRWLVKNSSIPQTKEAQKNER